MKKPGLLKRIFSFGKKQEEPLEVEASVEAEALIEATPIEATSVETTVIETGSGETGLAEIEAPMEAEASFEVTPEPEPERTPEPVLEEVTEQEPEPQELIQEEPVEEVLEAEEENIPEPSPKSNQEPFIGSTLRVEPEPVEEIAEQAIEETPKTEKEPKPEPEPEPEVEVDPAPEPVKPIQNSGQNSGQDSGIVVKSKNDDAEEPKQQGKSTWFQRMKQGLSRSSSSLTDNIASVFTKRKLDDDTLQDLEDILIQSDLGIETAMQITDALADQRMGKEVSDEEIRSVMADEIEKVLTPVAQPLELDLDHKPHVVLVVGVNGSGKTTTIGKLAQKLNDGGFSTMLAAGDTFRAAAIEQLHIWGERTNSPVVSRKLGSDAAGLAYDAWQQAKDEKRDVLLMDTAGRLQNRTELMDELAKIVRVLKKQDESAPHTVLLTLDATTGQNALNQVEIFKEVAGVNGLIMTKLDGTARGGILVAIAAKHKLPVYFIGVGEGVEDLEPFNAKDFAKVIANLD